MEMTSFRFYWAAAPKKSFFTARGDIEEEDDICFGKIGGKYGMEPQLIRAQFEWLPNPPRV